MVWTSWLKCMKRVCVRVSAHGSGALAPDALADVVSVSAMAITLDAVHAIMQSVLEQNNATAAALARQQMEALQQIISRSGSSGGAGGVGGGLTDPRGIGRPISFKGEEQKYAEWKAKLLAYLVVALPECEGWVRWALEEKKTITDMVIREAWSDGAGAVKMFSTKLYATMLSFTEEDAFRIVHSVKDQNGLEALRLMGRRYEPRTPSTKRALLKAIVNNVSAKKPQEIENNLMHVEEIVSKYESLAKESLPEDLKVTVIVNLCSIDLKEHLELITKDMSYKEVRDKIMNYVERKSENFANQVRAMEVDNHEEWTWWGGTGEKEYNDNTANDAQHQDMYYFAKGKGKGKGSGKGGERMPGAKGHGKGKGKDGKGGFQGQCY